MRMLALAAAIGVGFCLGAADARVFTDPAGRVVFDAPANWPVTTEPSAANITYLIAGNDDNECHFIATTNSNTANSAPYDVWRTARNDTQFADAFWVDQANVLTRVFPNRSAALLSRSRDDSGFWPIQRAELNSPARGTVYAGVQLRPGVDMLAFCVNYDGEPPVAAFDAVLRSMRHADDAAFRASAEERIAARAAAESAAAAATAAQPPPEEPRQRRN